MMPVQKPGKSKQDYATPRDFLRVLERVRGPIAADLAAHATNHVAPVWLGPGSSLCEDSLTFDWHRLDGLLWLNPPYGDIAPWAQKCAAESRLGARVLLLVPASVGANWYADHVHGQAMVLAIRPRLSFDGKHPFPKDLILAEYGPPPLFDLWKWK